MNFKQRLKRLDIEERLFPAFRCLLQTLLRQLDSNFALIRVFACWAPEICPLSPVPIMRLHAAEVNESHGATAAHTRRNQGLRATVAMTYAADTICSR